MGVSPWVVAPETTRVDLEWTGPDGAVRSIWLQLKQELSAGEQRRMMGCVANVTQEVARVRGADAPPATARMQWAEYSFARMETYIVDWSMAHDPEPSHRLPPKRSSYEALHQTLFELIDNAVDAHQQAAETAGKAPADAPKLSATSS